MPSSAVTRIVTGRTPVSVQWRGDAITGGSREHRRADLAANLRRVLADEASMDVSWETMSLAAQTVDALVDNAEFDRVVADLQERGLRVDQVLERQVV